LDYKQSTMHWMTAEGNGLKFDPDKSHSSVSENKVGNVYSAAQ